MNVLPLFGCTPNNRGDYIFIDANTPQEIALRETAANEFRQFYDELKKVKNGNMMTIEYFLNVRNLISIRLILFFVFINDFSIQIMILFIYNLSDKLMNDNSCI